MFVDKNGNSYACLEFESIALLRELNIRAYYGDIVCEIRSIVDSCCKPPKKIKFPKFKLVLSSLIYNDIVNSRASKKQPFYRIEINEKQRKYLSFE